MAAIGCPKTAPDAALVSPEAPTRAPDADPGPVGDDPAIELSEEAARYLTDCSARLLVEDESGEVVEECLAADFEQNYEPASSGCWDRRETCKTNCGPTCVACNDTCVPTCDRCKAECSPGDTPCLATCANARVECRNTCLLAREACRADKCGSAYDECEEAHAATVEALCPKCEEMRACFEDAYAGDHDGRACERRFKREPPECLQYCNG